MKKHAVCICAHKNWSQLDDLIDVLSSPLVDVYLHVDLKGRADFDIYAETHDFARHTNVIIVNSYKVDWGGYSQLLVELLLFKEVLEHKSEYNYVHLISGQDFPLKPIEKIIEECNDKKVDYLAYIAPQNKKKYGRRLRYYNILVPRIRQSVLCAYLRKGFLAAQMLLGINRLKKCPLKFEVGANWMSITLESLEYIVREYPKYDKYFRYGISAEECYKQMILETRKDARIVNDSKRFVIFEKKSQSPKTLTMKMLGDIERSDAFFARKFDDGIDKEVRLAIKRRIDK